MEPFSNFLASILLSRDEHPSEYQPGQEVEEEGRRRSSLQALRTPEDYFAVEGEGISITVRLKRSIVAQNLYIESRRYGITARVPEFGDAIPSSLIVTLVENSLRVLLDEVMVHERGAGTEFQLSISHRLFEEGPISSGIWPLSEESMEPGLSELLSRLIRVTQSKTREILFQDLEVELTLIRRPSLEGTGLLLPLPSTYAKKRYRATQGTGSVFYNTSQEYCFFTSIFHARAYNAFQDKMRGEGIAARKRGRRRLQQILDADDSSTVCYFEKFQINIRLANQDVASYPLLRSISEKMGVQISIHDEVQDFRRILMYPPQFCPNLEQIVLLRCTLLLEQEEKKSAQELSHYVSLRSPQALLSALRQSYCVLCGASVGRYTSHRCKRSDTPAQETQCRVCLRPSVTSQNMALLMPANRKSFCEKTLQSRPRSKKVQPCKNCGDIGSTLLCGKIHQMRCKGKQRRCTECKKWFYVDRGRYAGRPNVLRHDSCLYERYCGICQGSVIDTSICPSDSNHTCFIKPLYSPPPFPSRIISFDLEAVDEPEGFRANTACLVFNSGRGDYSEFEAVVFGECSPPGYRFNGKPLGVSFPVKLPNQDQACLTRELVRPKNGEKRIKLLKSEKKYWSNPDRAPSFGDRQGTDEMDRPVLNFRPDVEELLHGSSEDDPGSEEQGDHSLLTVQGILRSMDQPLQAGDADGNIEPNAPSHEPSIDLLEEQSAGELSSTHSCSSEQSGGKGTFHDSTKERNPLALGPTADFNLQAYQARSEFWQGDSESSAGEQDNSYQGKDKKKKKKNRSSREMEKLVKSFICSEAVVSEEEAVEEDSEDSGEETEDQAADIGQTRNTTTSQEHSRSRAVEQEELGVVGGGLAEVVEDTNQVSNEETSGDNTSEASSTVSSLMADRIVEAQEFPDSPEFLNSPEAHGPDDPPEGELNEEDVDILISKLEVVGSETIEEARQRARVGLSWMKRHQDRVSPTLRRYAVLDQMFQFIITRKEFHNSTMVAHYGSRFDSVLIIEYLSEKRIKFRTTQIGNKVIQIVVKGINVVIIDSFNFIQLSLDKCAAMFDLALRKGSFPHRLNKPQFYALEIRGLPPRQYYNFDKMTAEGKLAHEVLEASQAEEIFSFAHEIYSYNLDDTVILMAVIMSYITSCLNVETEISSLIKHAEHFSPSRNPLIFRKSEERREQEHLAVQRAYKTIMNERRQARREGRDSRDEFQDIKDAAELLDKIRELMYLKSDTLTVYPTAVAPLGRKTITISSYVNSLFLKYVVAQNRRMPICRSEDSSLGIRSSSLEEIDFLIFYSVCFTDETVSILNSTEQKGIQIDGRNFKCDLYVPAQRHVIEYLGCVIHGCPLCTKPEEFNHHGYMFGDALERTRDRSRLIRMHHEVDKLTEVWGCEFKAMRRADPAIDMIIETYKKTHGNKLEGLSLRECFKGGMVDVLAGMVNSDLLEEAMKRCFPEEDVPKGAGSGKFYDVNSFYPAVFMSYGSGFFPKGQQPALPYGKPVRLRSDQRIRQECNDSCQEVCYLHCPPSRWDKVAGFARVVVTGGSHTRFPIFRPTLNRMGSPIQISTSCKKCASREDFIKTVECICTEEEREFTVQATFYEIVYACQFQGFKLKHVSEIEFFPETNPDIFSDLLRHFAKVKICSDILPPHIQTMQDKELYAEDLSAKFGIKINGNDLSPNSGMKGVSKRVLVSLIGKMGQKIDRDEVHFVSTYDHLCKLRSGNEREVKTITVANSDLVLVRTASVKEGMKVFRKGSIYYAAYCTSFARVELTRIFERLEAESDYLCAYCDTDSVLLYPLTPNPPPIENYFEVGSKFGAFKLEQDGIRMFVGLAPKTYSYLTEDGQQIVKSKGFSHVGRILRDSDSIHVLFDEFTDTISQSSQKTNLYFNQPTFRVNASRPGFGVRNVTEFKKRLQLVTARRWLDSKVCFRKVGSKRRKVMPEFTFEVGKKTHAQRHVSEDEDDEHDPNQEAGYSYMNKLKFSFSAITYPFGYRKSSKNLKLDRLIKSLLE